MVYMNGQSRQSFLFLNCVTLLLPHCVHGSNFVSKTVLNANFCVVHRYIYLCDPIKQNKIQKQFSDFLIIESKTFTYNLNQEKIVRSCKLTKICTLHVQERNCMSDLLKLYRSQKKRQITLFFRVDFVCQVRTIQLPLIQVFTPFPLKHLN